MNKDDKVQIIKFLNGTIVHSGSETSIIGLSAKGQEIIELLEISPNTLSDETPEEYKVSEAEIALRIEIILKDLEQDNPLIAEGPDADVFWYSTSYGTTILTDKPDEIQSFLNDEYNFRYNYDAWISVRHLYKWDGMSERQEKEAFIGNLRLSCDGDRPYGHPDRSRRGRRTYAPEGVDCLGTINIHQQDDYEFCARCHEANEKCNQVDVNGCQVCERCFEADDLDHIHGGDEIAFYSPAIDYVLEEQSDWFHLLEAPKGDQIIAQVMDSMSDNLTYIAMHNESGTGVDVWVRRE